MRMLSRLFGIGNEDYFGEEEDEDAEEENEEGEEVDNQDPRGDDENEDGLGDEYESPEEQAEQEEQEQNEDNDDNDGDDDKQGSNKKDKDNKDGKDDKDKDGKDKDGKAKGEGNAPKRYSKRYLNQRARDNRCSTLKSHMCKFCKHPQKTVYQVEAFSVEFWARYIGKLASKNNYYYYCVNPTCKKGGAPKYLQVALGAKYDDAFIIVSKNMPLWVKMFKTK